MSFAIRSGNAGGFGPLFLLRTGARLPSARQPPDVHQPGEDSLSGEQYGACLVVPRAQRQRPRGDRAAAMEFRPRRPRGAGEAAQPVRGQRPAHDHGLSCRAQAGGDAARRLSCVEQRGPHDSCGQAIGGGCAGLRGLAGSARDTARSACWAPVWDPAWRSSRRRTTRAFVWESSTTSPCILRTWCGPGSPRRMCSKAFLGHVTQEELAPLLERDQPGQLSAAISGPRCEDAVDLGQPRQHLSAGLFAAGSGQLSGARICPTKSSICRAATTPPDSFRLT